MYYNECPICGAALDPGEQCEDCKKKKERIRVTEQNMSRGITEDQTGQLKLIFEER